MSGGSRPTDGERCIGCWDDLRLYVGVAGPADDADPLAGEHIVERLPRLHVHARAFVERILEAAGPSVDEGGAMHATDGDRIIVKGHVIGEPDRDCEVLEVRGPEGAPPYVIRWADTGHESLFYPGSDASLQHFEHTTGDDNANH